MLRPCLLDTACACLLHYQFGETSVFAAVIEDISVENVAEKMCEKDAGNVHPKEKLYSCKVPGFGKAIL